LCKKYFVAGVVQQSINTDFGQSWHRVSLERVQNGFGVIEATNQQPTGAEKLQTNFQTGIKIYEKLHNPLLVSEDFNYDM